MDSEREQSQEMTPEAISQPVMVDGQHLGRELGMFNLSSLTEPMLGGDKFTEVYFNTQSGNSYLICRRESLVEQQLTPSAERLGTEQFGREFLILDTRSNQEARDKGVKVTILSDEDIEKGALRVGKSFEFGKGGRTSSIIKITCVNGGRIYAPGYLQEYTRGKKVMYEKNFEEEF